MREIFGKAKRFTRFGLTGDELYDLAFEKGVLNNDFSTAVDNFAKATEKYAEEGNTMMVARSRANAYLYRYIITHDITYIPYIRDALQSLQEQEIEVFGSQIHTMPVRVLSIELACRLVESQIEQTQADDYAHLRDLHQTVHDLFQTINGKSLITYKYMPAEDGHNDKVEMRLFFHSGMCSYYEAMLKKDDDPAEAADDLAQAAHSFKQCNDQQWQQKIVVLLANWQKQSTCWFCNREMYGYKLNFDWYRADVTPYTKKLLETASQDSGRTIDIEKKLIAVCTPCSSMVRYMAKGEADKVRRELEQAMSRIYLLESRISRLENRSHEHNS